MISNQQKIDQLYAAAQEACMHGWLHVAVTLLGQIDDLKQKEKQCHAIG